MLSHLRHTCDGTTRKSAAKKRNQIAMTSKSREIWCEDWRKLLWGWEVRVGLELDSKGQGAEKEKGGCLS